MVITKNYIYFYYFAIGWTVILTICSFFVYESPLFLYEKGKCEQARQIINKMASMNKSSLATENWLLDKEEIIAYAQKDDPNHMLGKEGNEIEDEYQIKMIRNSMKPLGTGLLKFATSGNLSPPSTDNAASLMKKNPQIVVNLVIITMCWISISFNKYLISFNLKHIEGNIFINAMMSPLADILGHILCVPVQKMTNTRVTFMGSLALSFIFGASLIFVHTHWMIPVLIVFSKIGLASGYSLCYYMTSEYFPPLFLAFAFGVTQFAARAFTILAFPMSELEAPLPMVLFSITPIIAFILLFFVRSPVLPESYRKDSIKLVIDDRMRNTMKLSLDNLNSSDSVN